MAVLVCAVLLSGSAQGAAYVPADDGVVLERLATRSEPALAEITRLRRALAADPRNVELAVAVARKGVEAARLLGDPRYLGQAQAALAPWWSQAHAPVGVVVLRATIRQSLHDFESALVDLDRVLHLAPEEVQARLTRATVLSVRGRYAAARRDCEFLRGRVSTLVVEACLATPRSMSGEAAPALASLQLALTLPGQPVTVRVWAATLAGEIAARIGRPDLAQRHFVQALGWDSLDPYLKGAYADFLLENERPEAVIALLKDDTQHDGLLLRLALAEARLPSQRRSYISHRDDLAARFAAARRRGDVLHLREEARFALEVERELPRALALAVENWAIQREAADLRILDAAATASDALAVRREIAGWVADHAYEDVRLASVPAHRP